MQWLDGKNIGLAQQRKEEGEEKVMVTCGNEVAGSANLLAEPDATCYSAAQVLEYLLSEVRLNVETVS